MTNSDSSPILHGANISPYVRKVRVVLAYKGIEYNNTQQNPFGAPEEFVAKSPLSKIPCWEEGELILPDSSVIVSYLEYRYPDPPVLPAEAGPRARALWFQEYAATKLRDTVADVFFQRLIRPTVFKCEIDTQRVAFLLDSALPDVFDFRLGQWPLKGGIPAEKGKVEHSDDRPCPFCCSHIVFPHSLLIS